MGQRPGRPRGLDPAVAVVAGDATVARGLAASGSPATRRSSTSPAPRSSPAGPTAAKRAIREQPHPDDAQRRRRAAGGRRRHARLDLRRRVLRLPRRRGTRRGRRRPATTFSPGSASTGRPRRCAPASGARAWRSPASGSSSARAAGCSGRWRRSSARSSAGRSARAGSGSPGSTSRTSSGRCVHLAGRPESSGAYNLTAPEPVTNRS